MTAVLVRSEQFGDLEVDEARVLTFDDGLPGFPDARRFALLPVEGSDDLFFWLQSLDDPGLSFLSIIPWPFFPDYEPELNEPDREALDLASASDALVLCLVTVHREERRVTANLLGPVIINERTRASRQVVLTEQDLPVQAPLGPPAA